MSSDRHKPAANSQPRCLVDIRREDAKSLAQIDYQQHICVDSWSSHLYKTVRPHMGGRLAKPEPKSDKDPFLFVFFISMFSA